MVDEKSRSEVWGRKNDRKSWWQSHVQRRITMRSPEYNMWFFCALNHQQVHISHWKIEVLFWALNLVICSTDNLSISMQEVTKHYCMSCLFFRCSRYDTHGSHHRLPHITWHCLVVGWLEPRAASEVFSIFFHQLLAVLNSHANGNNGPSPPRCSYITVWVDNLWRLRRCGNPSGYAQERSRRVIVITNVNSNYNAIFHSRGLCLISD